jgi:hypothetical protein
MLSASLSAHQIASERGIVTPNVRGGEMVDKIRQAVFFLLVHICNLSRLAG